MSFFTDDTYFSGPTVTTELVEAAEQSLGVKLPPSYLALLRERNGGVPHGCCFPMSIPTSWARDHIEVRAIRGIGGEWGIDATSGLGSADMIREWGYPNVGLVLCHTPSGGHDTVMLDYKSETQDGEPCVVYVDEDRRPQRIAASFQDFIDQLYVCGSYRA